MIALATALLLAATPAATEDAGDRAIQEYQQKEATKAQLEALFEQAIQEAEANPKVARLARSVLLCYWSAVRKVAKEEIATQQKYAREGAGIVDMRALFAEQERMRRADEASARARKKLRGAPLSCKEQAVVVSTICLAVNRDNSDASGEYEEACRLTEMNVLIALMWRIEHGEID